MPDDNALVEFDGRNIKIVADAAIGKLTDSIVKLVAPATYALTMTAGAAVGGVVVATIVTVQKLRATIVYQTEFYKATVEIAIPTEAALDAATDAIDRIKRRQGVPDSMKKAAIDQIMRQWEYRMQVLGS